MDTKSQIVQLGRKIDQSGIIELEGNGQRQKSQAVSRVDKSNADRKIVDSKDTYMLHNLINS